MALRAVTGFKTMNSFYPYALAMLAAWTGLASADETNVAVFGLPLGAQLQISECAKKDLGGLTIYPPAAATCFERLGTQERVRATAPVENDSILIRFAAAEAPAVMSGGTGIGLVVNREPIQARLERLDGSVLDCTTAPLPDGATLVTFQDVTDSVNVERALIERADALQDADRIKNAFVGHVSYELRTPLTNIIGFANLLLDPTIGPAIGPITDKQRDYLDSIDKSSSALLAIINDILDLTTIDAGAMSLDLKDVDIRHAVDSAVLGLQDRIAEKAVLLDVRAAPDVGSFLADERRVRQVLFNLLSNAISFSPAGDVVRLSVERRDGAIVFSVTDRGPGIPPEISERVFDRFESHALGSEHRGAGLGLSIVRSFVELHGGTVKLDSAVGRGTTVTCIFPLKQAQQEAAAE